jgi:hypothetical protein
MPESRYEVCLSFAGEDRDYVEKVAVALRSSDIAVFYDAHEKVNLWGKNLYQHLDLVYRNASRYCVAFFSSAYVRKVWTRHELASAQARAFEENREYILPVRFDDTDIPGVPPTIGYIDLRSTSPEELAQLIIAKLQMPHVHPSARPAGGTRSPAVQQAEALLASSELSERKKGLSALRAMDSTDAADGLTRALTSPFPHVRVESAIALARRGDRRASNVLIDLFADPSTLDLEAAVDGLNPEDRQAVLARALEIAPRRVLRYLDRVKDIGMPQEAFSRELCRCIDSPDLDDRAAAIILVSKFKVRDGVLPQLTAALLDEREFGGHHIEAFFAPRICDQALLAIAELKFEGALTPADFQLWEKRRNELGEYTRKRKSRPN